MPRIAQATIKEVADRTDLVALIGEYTRLEKKGGDWWGCCPFHHEKTPSFHVIPGRNMYHCFGCGAGGTAITFYQEIEKLTFVEAVLALAKKSGAEVIYDGNYVEEKDETVDYSDLYNRVAGTFHFLLISSKTGKKALEYIKNRGLTDETIRRFSLGYAPADRRWLKTFLRSKNYSDEYLAESGLFSKNYPDAAFFSHRLMFPIADRNGKTVAFGGRLLEGDGPKYLNSGDLPKFSKGHTLYAFNVAKQEIRKRKAVIFCEGYMDVLAYHQCGIPMAVAPLGTALTQDQVHLVSSFVETVYLSFDSDEAGQKATMKAILLCREQGLTVKIIHMAAEAKDPAEIMQNLGPEALTNCVNGAIVDVDYLLSLLARQFPTDTPEGKTQAMLAFFPYVEALKTDIQKESSLDQLCQTFNLRPDAVRHDYIHQDAARKRVEARPSAPRQGQNEAPIKLNAELRIMLFTLANIQHFPELRAALGAEDFEDSLAKELFIALEECYRQDTLSLDGILPQVSDQRVRGLITGAAASGEYHYTEEAMRDSIRRLRKNSLERKRNDLMNRIRLLQSQISTLEDRQRMETLLSQKMNLDSELKGL
jgi:DNA primase